MNRLSRTRSIRLRSLSVLLAWVVVAAQSCGERHDPPVAPMSVATQLVFTTAPITAVAGVIITPAIVVTAQDASGNSGTSFTAAVTLSIGANLNGATLSGIATVTAVAGVATFSSISFNNAAPGYTLVASASGLTSATSAPFTITPGTVTPPAFPFASLATGASHTCGLTAVGAAYCWGNDSIGQLGTGDTINRSTPKPVVGGLVFATLAPGDRHTCGLTAGGAYCWGHNGSGELGDGTTTNRLTPTSVTGSPVFANLSAGADYSCGLTAGGAAYCWGDNSYGELGTGDMISHSTPTPVAGGLVFASLAAGRLSTCGLTTGGAAYCWGYNQSGVLAVGTLTNYILTPQPVVGGLMFASLAMGSDACGLTTGGAAYCWGDNSYGELGDGLGTYEATHPTKIATILLFASLSPGGNHTCGLTAGGVAYCWGDNDYGEAGNGTTGPRTGVTLPARVAGGLVFSTLAPGFFHTCGLTAAGGAYCWGYNFYGQVGDGTTADRSVPTPVIRP
jgi:alpha-tubulin suppressor-like RCC1 family protein